MNADPTSAHHQYHLAWILIAAGQEDRGLEISRGALNLDPGACLPLISLGLAYEKKRMSREAIETWETYNRCASQASVGIPRIAIVHALAGRRAEAESILEKLEKSCRQRYCSSAAFAELYLVLGEKDRGLRFFEKAIEDRDPNFFSTLIGFYLGPLTSNTEYQALRKKANLDGYQ